MEKIINLLQKNARMPMKDMALATGLSEAEVSAKIAEMEQQGIILGYTPIINWNKETQNHVTALVEIKFSLNNNVGFEELAKQIASMAEVESVHLMSGGYDLCVILTGKNIQEIAFFVNEKLSTMPCVLSTTTHFVLKSYKEHGILTFDRNKDRREASL